MKSGKNPSLLTLAYKQLSSKGYISQINELASLFTKKYPTLAKATSETEAIIPGYLYNEINAITYEDDGTLCKSLLEYLLSKLQKGSNNVQLKVLKLLLFLIKNGHHVFKEELQRKDYLIKEVGCVHGAPDPFCGNEQYLLIRNEAKEVLEALFDENILPNSSLSSSSEEGKVKLMGYGSNASVGKMHGFGNSPQPSKSVGEIMAKNISSVMDKIRSTEDQNPKVQNECLSKGFPQYEPVIIDTGNICDLEESKTKESNISNLEKFHSVKKKQHRVHKPGRAGGGWDDDDDGNGIQDSKDTSKDSFLSNNSSLSVDSLDKSDTAPPTDWTEEQKVIEQFTSCSASFPPSSTEIIDTRKRCSLLNCDNIIHLLAQRLDLPESNVKMRSLVLLETLLHHDIASVESVNKLMLQRLEKLANSEMYNPVKVKSKKLVLILEKLTSLQNR